MINHFLETFARHFSQSHIIKILYFYNFIYSSGFFKIKNDLLIFIKLNYKSFMAFTKLNIITKILQPKIKENNNKT